MRVTLPGVLRVAVVGVWLCGCEAVHDGEPPDVGDGVAGAPEASGPDHPAGPAAVPPEVEHIVGGRVDETDVAVVALTVGGRAFCSGTLVARRTVFTAGHCLVGHGLEPGRVRAFFGTRVGGPGVSLPVVRWAVHPGYEVLPDGVPLHDVAAVTLGADAPVPPLPWRSTKLPSLVGERVRMVGYGVTDARHQSGAGTRRAVTQTIVDQDAGFLYYGDGVAGTCQGDSGGPTLVKLGGVTVLAAVTSYGDVTCVQAGANTRVDANAPFLAAQIDGPPPGPVPPEPEPADSLAELVEVEPNGGYGAVAQRLDGPSAVFGALDPVGDVDYFRVEVPGGATLGLTLEGPPAGGVDLDVRLTSSAGVVLAAGENGPGSPEALAWTNASSSTRVVYVRIYGLYDAGGAGPWEAAYVLRVAW